MKKILLLATLVLGMVSCMKDQSFDANVGGEADVVLSVALPADVTRAMDNDSAKGAIGNIDLAQYDIRYILEVFDASNTLAKRVENYEDSATSTTFALRLIPGRHYSFVVWADFVAQGTEVALHYNAEDLRNIEIIGEQKAMDESRDAYTGIFRTSDNDGQPFSSSSQISFELKRPFAKLRVVTNDIDEIDSYSSLVGATIEYRAQTYQKYDALTKQSSQLATVTKSVDYTSDAYLYAGEPTTEGEQTLFADYILGTQSGTVQFIMTVDDSTTETIPTITFNTAIPVERNYLTTIYGPILTDFNRATVEIKYAFENEGNFEDAPYYQVAVTNAYEYLVAYYEGREMVALNDIVVTQADVDAYWATRSAAAIHPVLNLNGNTITFVNDTNTPLITVADGSSFTVSGGSIVVVGDGVGIENNGTLNITGSEIEAEDGTAIVNNAVANIEDTELNKGAVENNGTTNVNGGEVSDDAIENGDDAILGTYVYNAEELQAAINAAVKTDAVNEISFGADIAGTVTLVQNPGVKVVINGCDYKYEGSIKIHSNSYFYAGAAVTIKNVNFEASEADVNFIEALENGSQRYSTNITVEDCTFTATGEAVNTAVGVQIKASKNAKILNSTAQGLHSLVQAQSCDETVVVDNCEVNGKNGVAFKQVKAATVKNTTIVAQEYGIRYDGNVDNYGIVVNGCNITAYQPLIVRKMTGKNNTIALEGENTLTTEEAYDIVITNGSDDAAYVTPTGTYTLTGADAFVVYPRNVVSSWDEFTAALAADTTFVLLANDITYDKSYTITKDITVDLNGKTFAIDNVSAMLNIGDSKNSSKPNVTIKNGNFNTIIYALSGNVTIQDVVFGGTISYVSASQGVVSTKYANLLMENCKMTNVKKSGTTKPRSLCTEGRSSGYLILRDCNFKNSNLDRPYINPLNGTATLELTNCSLYSGATNIDLGKSLVWSNTNLNLNGCSGGFTFTISRASTSLTEDELAVYRAIKQNNSGTKRFIFTDGEKNNL